jgi:hypothetical protein
MSKPLVEGLRGAHAGYVLAHGAGAGMTHPFMAAAAKGLAERSIATLRYEFPYMQAKSLDPVPVGGHPRRPDPPKIAQAAVREAVIEGAGAMPGLPIFAGGKSFGGRMTSQAQAAAPLPGVRGLIFLGFPLHAAGKPSDERAKHLFDVKVPMLFLQGSRDALADLTLLEPLVKKLGTRATLEVVDDADHSFHVPARTGRKDTEVMADLLDRMARWIAKN